MTTAYQQPPGRYTTADWEALDHDPDGPRVELINGRFVITPAPAFVHQAFADELRGELAVALRAAGRRDLYAVTAVGVKVAPPNAFIPDVAVIRRPKVGAVALEASDLLLAVEVVSPSTRRRDRMVKPDVYAAAGVPFFWRVEPSTDHTAPVVDCFALDGAEYVRRVTVDDEGPVRVTAAPVPVILDLAELYARIYPDTD